MQNKIYKTYGTHINPFEIVDNIVLRLLLIRDIKYFMKQAIKEALSCNMLYE